MQQKPLILLVYANSETQYLDNIPVEALQLEKPFRYAKQTGFELKTIGYSTTAQLIETITSERQRLVLFHFAGHSGEDYLQLDQGQVHANGFSQLLQSCPQLQLVFLNACNNANQVEQFRSAGIPIVIGTREPINDQQASTFSRQFYYALSQQKQSVSQAWKQAKASVETQTGQDFRSLDLATSTEANTNTDWSWFIQPEDSDWQLHQALQPCQQLPTIETAELPAEPYKNLAYYRQQDAAIFFGRCQPILDCLKRLQANEPLLLLHGQTGVGKSSFLQAGLIPRLQAAGYQTLSYRHSSNQHSQYQLLQTLLASDDPRQAWLDQEKQQEKPLIIVMDQMEELLFNDSHHQAQNNSNETASQVRPLEQLFQTLQQIFYADSDSQSQQQRPQGKLVISLRKEWFAEFNEACRRYQINLQDYLLKPLDKAMIMEIIEGISHTPALHQKYQLDIENDQGRLAEYIADDLLVSEHASLAPTLQIILSKLWEAVSEQQPRRFNKALYEKLRKQGILLKDYIQQQIHAIQQQAEWGAAADNNGLIIDILYAHTSPQLTAHSIDKQDYQQHYAHIPYDNELQQALIDKYLLIQPENSQQPHTRLAHDTLAPLIRQAFEQSEKAGQRARRILDNRRADWLHQLHNGKNKKKSNQHHALLDQHDLAQVINGKDGTRHWDEQEASLIRQSQRAVQKAQRRRRIWQGVGVIALGLIIGTSFISYRLYLKANAETQRANQSREKAEQLVNKMVFDLRDKLKPIGRLDIMSDIQHWVDDYYQGLGNRTGSADIKRRRAVNIMQTGQTLVSRGKLEQAITKYQQGIAVFKQLAESDPSNANWQRDLSVSYERLGDIYSAQGKLDDALNAFSNDMKITKKLAEDDPSNANWQRDLSVSYEKLAGGYQKQDKIAEAIGQYKKAHSIYQKLIRMDASNAETLRFSTVPLIQLMGLYAQNNQSKQAIQSGKEALAILEQLEQEGKLHGKHKTWPRIVKQALDQIKQK